MNGKNIFSLGFILLLLTNLAFAQEQESRYVEIEKKIIKAIELRDNYNYEDALDDFNAILVELGEAQTPEEKNLKAQTYYGISELFNSLELFEDALDFNQRAINLYKEIDDLLSAANLYNSRGGIYFYYYHSGVEDYSLIESSRETYQEAIKIYNSLPDANEELPVIYVNMSNSYLLREDVDELDDALMWAELAKKESLKQGEEGTLVSANMLLSRIFLDLKEPQKALDSALETLELAETNEEYHTYLDSYYYNIYEAYQSLGDEEKAYEILQKRVVVLDNRVMVPKKDFASIVTSRETERIRDKAKVLEANLFQKEKQAQKFQRTNIILLLLLGTIALLGYNLLRSQSLKRKNLELELEKKEQRAELDMVNAMMDGKEIERKEIGRFLHDHVSALVNAANIQLEVMANETGIQDNKKLETTQTILDDIADKVRNLSHQLLSNVLQKYGLAVAFEELCQRLTGSATEFSCISSLPEGKRYNEAIENKLYGIAQELCNNVLKHSKATEAFIELHESNDHLVMVVADNGVGFEEKDIQAGGVGLHQIKTRINSMGGDLDIYSNGKTKINISIPLEIAEKHIQKLQNKTV